MNTKRFFIAAAVFVTLSLIMVPNSNSKSLGDNSTLNTGFRGIKWFTKKSGISNLYPYEAFVGLPGVTYSLRKNDNKSLGDIPLTNIVYCFNKEQEFDRVNLFFGKEHLERVIKYFTNILGEYSSTSNKVVWDLPFVEVVVESYGAVSITPKKVKGDTGGGI